MEDPELELDIKLLAKHNRTRKRINNIYNKREDEFDTKLQFDDYLEEREDIIFNLTEGIDVDATEAKVRAYETANSASIAANVAKQTQKARALQGTDIIETADVTMEDKPAVIKKFEPRLAANQLPPRPGPVPNQTKKDVPREPTPQELRAGGWDPDLPKIRTIQDAFSSLVLSPT